MLECLEDNDERFEDVPLEISEDRDDEDVEDKLQSFEEIVDDVENDILYE